MGRPALKPRQKLQNEAALLRFLTAATTDVGDADHVEPTSHLYIAFKRFCSQERIVCMKPAVFGRELGKTAEFDPIRPGWGNGRSWYGIKLRPRWKKIVEQAIERQKEKAAVDARPKRKPPRAVVARFLNLCCERSADAVEPFAHLFEAHRQWCGWVDYRSLNRVAFGKMLTKFKIEDDRIGHSRQRGRRGVRLKPEIKRYADRALAA